jgi:hypothetical protein
MSKNMYGLPNHIYLVLGGFKYTSDPNGLIANVLDEHAPALEFRAASTRTRGSSCRRHIPRPAASRNSPFSSESPSLGLAPGRRHIRHRSAAGRDHSLFAPLTGGPDISRLQRTFLTDEAPLVPGIVLPTRRRVVLADRGRLLRSRPLPPQRRSTGDRQSNLPRGWHSDSWPTLRYVILPSLNGSARTSSSALRVPQRVVNSPSVF